MKILVLLVASLFLSVVTAWSKEDYEIFRLRDEVELAEGAGVTFYELLGITPYASQDEINKAYRKKSKSLHPDKVKHSFIASNSVPKSKKGKSKPGVNVSRGPSQKEVQKAVKLATEQFGRLGLVTKILRGENRERYDHFLKNGFPKWRGTGYYYSRFRPGLGSVLVGLFLAGGGAAHYAALVLSWKRQREFVNRYIRQARRAAWGDESGIKGIPGLSGSTAALPPPPVEEPDLGAMQMNRRQKRQMEKENKKEKSGKAGRNSGKVSGTQTPVGNTTPDGEKKRVVAENGKILIVDAIGNVFLEEEDEEGNVQAFLLDVEEIPRPTIRDTALYRVPMFVYHKVLARFQKNEASIDREEEEQQEHLDISAAAQESSQEQDSGSSFELVGVDKAAVSNNGVPKKRNKKSKK